METGQDGTQGQGGGRRIEDNLLDLISGYGREAETKGKAAGLREGKVRSGKGKGGEK